MEAKNISRAPLAPKSVVPHCSPAVWVAVRRFAPSCAHGAKLDAAPWWNGLHMPWAVRSGPRRPLLIGQCHVLPRFSAVGRSFTPSIAVAWQMRSSCVSGGPCAVPERFCVDGTTLPIGKSGSQWGGVQRSQRTSAAGCPMLRPSPGAPVRNVGSRHVAAPVSFPHRYWRTPQRGSRVGSGSSYC